jgi:hypothetical protein
MTLSAMMTVPDSCADCVWLQVVRLMRMLVQLCQTLDKVPEEVRGTVITRNGHAVPGRLQMHLSKPNVITNLWHSTLQCTPAF